MIYQHQKKNCDTSLNNLPRIASVVKFFFYFFIYLFYKPSPGSSLGIISFTFFSACFLGIMIICPHPQHLSLKSMPTLRTSHSGLPQGWGFFIFSLSPICMSIINLPLPTDSIPLGSSLMLETLRFTPGFLLIIPRHASLGPTDSIPSGSSHIMLKIRGLRRLSYQPHSVFLSHR